MKHLSVKSHDTEDQEVLIAWDDVSGARLNPENGSVHQSEQETFLRRDGVDINKQDDTSPLHRSRLVAKEFNKGKDPDLCNSAAGTLASVGEPGGKQKRKRRWTMEAYVE